MISQLRDGLSSGYPFILGTIVFTVYGQLVIKWQVERAGAFPDTSSGRIVYLVEVILNPWVLSSLVAAFLAFLCWVAALTRFDLSYAYPFTSLSYVAVLLLSAIILGESITPLKLLGLLLIIIGLGLGSRS